MRAVVAARLAEAATTPPVRHVLLPGDLDAAPVDGVWAGDHFGLTADLSLPRRPRARPAPAGNEGVRRADAGTRGVP